jgi:hypothetical protein
MRPIIFVLLTAGATSLGAGAAHAQEAAQQYPYCSMSTSSGATNCYISSRAQCGDSCIDNPSYVAPRAEYRGAPVPRERRRRPEPR